MREVRPPRRLLIVCLDNLGDLAFCSALVPPLRENCPGAEISLWAKSYASGLLPFIPGLARTHACDPFWDRAPGSGRGSMAGFLRAFREVAGEGYDTALLPSTHWRVALAARAAGIPARIGFAQRGAGPWLSDALSAERRDRPVLEECARLLAPLKVGSGALTIRLEVPGSLEPARREMRARLGAGPIVGIHPFAGDERRAAPPRFWTEVLSGLRGLGVGRVLVVGRPEEAAAFISRTGRLEGLDLRASADLGGGLTGGLLALSLCRAFVGNDSGPLHCAAGLGVPVLGLYLPGDWPRAMPQGRGPWRAIREDSPSSARAADALEHLRGFMKAAD